MKHLIVSTAFATLLSVGAAQAQTAPAASTQTSQGTIIWNTPGAPTTKGSSANASSGAPDRNGIIWNDTKPSSNSSGNNGAVTTTGPSPMTGHVNGDTIIWDTPAQRTPPRVASAAPQTSEQCREFTTEIIIDGQRQPAHGTVCRQPDGAWRVVNR